MQHFLEFSGLMILAKFLACQLSGRKNPIGWFSGEIWAPICIGCLLRIRKKHLRKNPFQLEPRKLLIHYYIHTKKFFSFLWQIRFCKFVRFFQRIFFIIMYIFMTFLTIILTKYGKNIANNFLAKIFFAKNEVDGKYIYDGPW